MCLIAASAEKTELEKGGTEIRIPELIHSAQPGRHWRLAALFRFVLPEKLCTS
jgi:hypothetical protein